MPVSPPTMSPSAPLYSPCNLSAEDVSLPWGAVPGQHPPPQWKAPECRAPPFPDSSLRLEPLFVSVFPRGLESREGGVASLAHGCVSDILARL